MLFCKDSMSEDGEPPLPPSPLSLHRFGSEKNNSFGDCVERCIADRNSRTWSVGRLAGCAIVGILRAEIRMILEWFDAGRLLLVPDLLHLLHDTQEVAARQFAEILDGPTAAEQLGK